MGPGEGGRESAAREGPGLGDECDGPARPEEPDAPPAKTLMDDEEDMDDCGELSGTT